MPVTIFIRCLFGVANKDLKPIQISSIVRRHIVYSC